MTSAKDMRTPTPCMEEVHQGEPVPPESQHPISAKPAHQGPAENGQPALKLLWPIYFLLPLSFMTKKSAFLPLLPSAILSDLAEPRPANTPWPRDPPENKHLWFHSQVPPLPQNQKIPEMWPSTYLPYIPNYIKPES